MTKTYKRKQYTNVEAFIYSKDKEPDWFVELMAEGKIKASLAGFDGFNNIVKLEFETKNGTSWGKSGDYVVKNGQGCVYPVLHDVFLELYEELETIDEIYLQCENCGYGVITDRANWERESINPDCPRCLTGNLIC